MGCQVPFGNLYHGCSGYAQDSHIDYSHKQEVFAQYQRLYDSQGMEILSQMQYLAMLSC